MRWRAIKWDRLLTSEFICVGTHMYTYSIQLYHHTHAHTSTHGRGGREQDVEGREGHGTGNFWERGNFFPKWLPDISMVDTFWVYVDLCAHGSFLDNLPQTLLHCSTLSSSNSASDYVDFIRKHIMKMHLAIACPNLYFQIILLCISIFIL